jgi:hypothetical protein
MKYTTQNNNKYLKPYKKYTYNCREEGNAILVNQRRLYPIILWILKCKQPDY